MFKKSRDEDVYEYVYPRKRYRKTLWTCVWLWIGILVVRLIAYGIWGYDFAVSPYNLGSLGLSGILVGVIIQNVRILRSSTHIGELNCNTGAIDLDPSLMKPDSDTA